MGMKNSAQSFQKLAEHVLRGIPNVFIYLDDLLIYNKNEQEHLQTLEELFQRLSKAGLTIALDKCLFNTLLVIINLWINTVLSISNKRNQKVVLL